MEPAQPTPVSVLIITYNEEANIAGCLESVRWAGEVFVVDSLSSDRTQEIASRMGAKVYPHPFEGYARQRNWALENLPFSHDWVLMLDADERITAPLAEQIRRVASRPDSGCAGYYLNRRFYFLGRWLRHGGLSPSWILRLFRRHAARCENRGVNEHMLLTGAAGRLDEAFHHRDSRPLSAWIERHKVYADLEAEQYFSERFRGGCEASIPARLWGTQPERKRWIKLHVWNRFPLLLRPFLLFFRNYFLKGGFLDGKPGFIYHVLWSFWYPFLIDARIFEMQRGAGAGVSSLVGQGGVKVAPGSTTEITHSTQGQ